MYPPDFDPELEDGLTLFDQLLARFAIAGSVAGALVATLKCGPDYFCIGGLAGAAAGLFLVLLVHAVLMTGDLLLNALIWAVNLLINGIQVARWGVYRSWNRLSGYFKKKGPGDGEV